MTVLATVSLSGDGPESRVSADELLALASGEDFARWEQQLTATGNCANPVRLHGRIDAIDRATGEKATIYDTDSEPGGLLRIPCGNRREDICPPCSEVYKGDARQIIRSGLTGGKGIPESVATHPCVFATLTAPGFGPVHTIRTAAMRTSVAARTNLRSARVRAVYRTRRVLTPWAEAEADGSGSVSARGHRGGWSAGAPVAYRCSRPCGPPCRSPEGSRSLAI
jgi:hypothetical protein